MPRAIARSVIRLAAVPECVFVPRACWTWRMMAMAAGSVILICVTRTVVLRLIQFRTDLVLLSVRSQVELQQFYPASLTRRSPLLSEGQN